MASIRAALVPLVILTLVPKIATKAFAGEKDATFQNYSKGYIRQQQLSSTSEILVLNITTETPSHIDWHHKGDVTAVKNQAACGSCWAFSTIEGVETAVKRHGDGLHHFSTEELVSCDGNNNGCQGGNIDSALQYLESKGVASASDYPDFSSTHPHSYHCRWNHKSIVKITGHSYAVQPCRSSNCEHQSESALATAVASHGPMSICINTAPGEAGDWQRYQGGVMRESCSADAGRVDHCVQLIGYSKAYKEPYWRIRNSWGAGWGESGFIRIPYGKGNRCCVACEAHHISAQLKESRRRRSKVVVSDVYIPSPADASQTLEIVV